MVKMFCDWCDVEVPSITGGYRILVSNPAFTREDITLVLCLVDWERIMSLKPSGGSDGIVE